MIAAVCGEEYNTHSQDNSVDVYRHYLYPPTPTTKVALWLFNVRDLMKSLPWTALQATFPQGGFLRKRLQPPLCICG